MLVDGAQSIPHMPVDGLRTDLPADEKVNVIGEVPAEYDLLLDCIKRGKTFRMVKVQ